MALEDEMADLEQSCNPAPTCTWPAIYDTANCQCVETETSSSYCSSGFMASNGGICGCTLSTPVSCPSGYKRISGCMCSDDVNTVSSFCSSGYSRPASGACYCTKISDPKCDTGTITSNKCGCQTQKTSTPGCSNTACSFDSTQCSCA